MISSFNKLVFSCELKAMKLSKMLFCVKNKQTFKNLKNRSPLNSKKFTPIFNAKAPTKNKPGKVVNLGSQSEKRL